MSCNNCTGTVWFDHETKRWRHSRSSPPGCRHAEPYNINDDHERYRIVTEKSGG